MKTDNLTSAVYDAVYMESRPTTRIMSYNPECQKTFSRKVMHPIMMYLVSY